MRINSEETSPNSIVALPIVCNCFSYLLVVNMRPISASEPIAGAAASHFPDERGGDGRDVGFHPAGLRGATGVCLPHPEQADPRHCLGFHAQACRNRVWTTGQHRATIMEPIDHFHSPHALSFRRAPRTDLGRL